MSETLIQLENVTFTRDANRILDGVSWTVRAGENWALLGGNGAGKSTLLKILRGDLWPDAKPGQRTYFFDDVATFSPIRAKEKVALISFEHQAKYWRREWNLSGRELLLTGFFDSELLHQNTDAAQNEAAEKLALRLGLGGLLEADIQQVSQGELRRLLIARALLREPRILILDEFCAGLDALARGAMLDFIATLAQSGTQLVCSTHRREEILPCLQNVLQLEGGKVLSIGQRDHVVPAKKLSHEPPRTVVPSSIAAAQLPYLLRVQNANVILDEKPILHDFNWQMNPGEHWAVIGANGSGKSTFLKMLTGDLWPARGGHVHRFGKTTFEGLWKLKEKIALLSHEFQAKYHEAVTAREAVYSGYYQSVGMGLITDVGEERRHRVQTLLEWLDIAHLAERPFQGLSTGEGRKILLARALVTNPQIMLLDEPFDGLDEAARAFLTARLHDLAQSGTHFVLVSHHQSDFPSFLTHEMHLENGRIQQIKQRGI